MKPQCILLTFLALILQTQTSSISGLMSFSSLEKTLTHTDINAYASSSPPSLSSPDEIPILKDLDGYYVNAKLANSTSSNDQVKMMLGLSSSDILLIQQDCLNFKQYNCPYYHCNKIPETQQTVSYPDFTAETIQASSAFVSLDHANWESQGKALLATSCSTQRDDLKGSNRYGVLGLGTQGSSKDNFFKNKTFSISFTKDVKSGTLKFYRDDMHLLQLTSFPTDSNWVAPFKGYIQGAGIYDDIEVNLAFDINSDAIGFPAAIFKRIVKGIEERNWMSSMVCTNDTFQPTCNYTRRVGALPTFTIQGKYPISFNIEPEIYVKDAKSSNDHVTSITLNFQQLNSSLSSGKSYVTSDYENMIILDARVMSYFYTVFDASGPRNMIELWNATNVKEISDNSTKNSSDRGTSSKGPLLVGLIILISIAGSCAILKKCNSPKTAPQAPVIIVNNSTTIVNNIQTDYSGVVEIQNNHQYIPPCNVGYGGYIHQENHHL